MSRATARFALHYVEMVIAMFLGMLVLYMPADMALSAPGSATRRTGRSSCGSSAWRSR